MKKYPVITLCGSTRFMEQFLRVQKELTLDGYIVISVGLFDHAGDDEVWEDLCEDTETKDMLDDMHRAKISMSDEIFVINPDGYIGERTWSLICFAKMLQKKILFMRPVDETEIDKVVQEHIRIAERLAEKQLDHIRHSNGYYDIEDYTYLVHRRKKIVDPWINVETHYDGTPWPDHKNPEQGEDPFEYYGKEKVAAFIEKIIARFGELEL